MPLELDASGAHCDRFCRDILPAVSRTFALNIPVLPAPLDLAVTVAYLLCRMADTLEDEARERTASATLLAELARLTGLPEDWRRDVAAFSSRAVKAVPEAPAAERRLLEGSVLVLGALAALPERLHAPVARCVSDMTRGMTDVSARVASRGEPGLRDIGETLEYCYYVAGTVGEMLTEFFILSSPQVAARAGVLRANAVAFGRALQLTNILKDVRADLDVDRCWLPRSLLAAKGLHPEDLKAPHLRDAGMRALQPLFAVAHHELRAALDYALALPAKETGLRLFCLWPLLLAVLTLGKIHRNRALLSDTPTKVSRGTVRLVVASSRALVRRDAALRFLFDSMARSLPPPASASEPAAASA